MEGAEEAVPCAVSSADGTTIGYRRWGRGPALLVLHGAMESAADHADLAVALAERFTVCVPDRRGRGASGPYRDDDGLDTEVEDARAVLAAAGARRVFGVSSGGAIALRLALAVPDVEEVAVYEPAISLPGEESHVTVPGYERALARGRPGEALVAVLRGLRIGPGWLRLLPRVVSSRLVAKLVTDEDRDAAPGDVTFGSLIPTVRHDFRVADESGADLDRVRGLRARLLLLGGSRTAGGYLEPVLERLAAEVAGATRVTLEGADHIAAANRAQGGRPEQVARALADFFTTG